jgi:hypothetical protein
MRALTLRSGHTSDGEPSQRSDSALRFRRRGSLQVWIAGERRGKWKDHEAGEYGDALGLVAHLRRTNMKEAYGWALDWLGLALDLPQKSGGFLMRQGELHDAAETVHEGI